MAIFPSKKGVDTIMPIFEYKCDECNELRERIERNNKVYGSMVCENCGAKMSKTLSSSHFILKGNGWYKTDYKD